MKRICLFMLICLLLGIAACNDKKEQTKETNAGEDKIQIGFSFDSFVIERWQRDRDVFVFTLRNLGRR